LTSTSDKSEVRKIQFTGRSTYIISLPKRWMIEMNLKAGDPVTITRESNNSLTIIPNAERRPDSANEVTAIVLQNESGSSLKRKVVSMYLAGYNIMHLKSKTGRINPSQRDAVREVVRRNLVATEIIADASDLIQSKCCLAYQNFQLMPLSEGCFRFQPLCIQTQWLLLLNRTMN
jgi:phosphate uptake regulator